MKIIQVEELAENFLIILDKVVTNKTSILITRYNQTIAKIIPVEQEIIDDKKPLKDSVNFLSDIISSIDEQWKSSV